VLKNNWLIFADIDKLSGKLACDILDIAEKSIQLNNIFKIVLTGGVSIMSVYKILSNSESDWSKWHVYIGDERCLPLKYKDRNDYTINNIWLNNGLIPKENINFMHAELGVNDGALHYEDVLKNIGDFDVVLLSVGEDGHTASLFPNHIYDENKSVVVECNAPKFPKDRISMSYSRLDQSRNVFKIISGISKKNVVKLWLQGVNFPINKITGYSEKVYICEDALLVKSDTQVI
jgi:6-phosphogluconolactonase